MRAHAEKYDLIGDIHGHCDTLEKLLTQLGYTKKDNVWQHPERKIIFVGDYIDRGPKIRETLALVKGMTDAGHAIALMGNHEYNAVGYATPDGRGGYLRKHDEKNKRQHGATLAQFDKYPDEWEMYLQWFKTLPLFLDLGNLRAVHACWDEEHIAWMKEKNYHTLTDELLHKAYQWGTRENKAIEETLKGKELNIPQKFRWLDKDGHSRTANRIKWWIEKMGARYGDFIFSCPPELTDEPIPDHLEVNIYPADAPPVFIGHYWLDELEPALQTSNVVCLDYSVAKEGYLVAYRWDGEQVADKDKFVVQTK